MKVQKFGLSDAELVKSPGQDADIQARAVLALGRDLPKRRRAYAVALSSSARSAGQR